MTAHDQIRSPAIPNRRYCSRCGTCCKKGGPALHRSDKALVESGAVPLTALYTIRAAEPVWDNIRGEIKPAATDIIKIRGTEDHPVCRFYDPAIKACRIYDRRPSECVAQKCWDTRDIERIYARERLSRIDLLHSSPSLCDLVQTHQKCCDYNEIGMLSSEIRKQRNTDAEKKLLEIMRYDRSIRDLTVEKSHISPQITDFLFGRPLPVTVYRFRLELRQTGQGYCLIPITQG